MQRLIGPAPLACVCSVLLLAVISGCGGSKIPTAKVAGTIQFEGQPMVGGGQVLFVPLADAKGKGAIGAINAKDGTFELSTFKAGDGAVLGEHRVQVVQDVVIEHAVYEYERGPDGDTQKLISPEKRISEDQEIPEVYASANSPARATVEKGGNQLTIELVRKP